MTKKMKTVFEVFTESVGLYFSNIDKFIKYMTFPVLGQIFGLSLVFLTTYFYSINMPKLIDKYPDLNSLPTLITISVVIALPGLAIFCKAFWEYLVAYGAINSMYSNMVKSGKLYDFQAHNELITRRTLPFIGLWMIIGIFSLIALFPLFWVICGILAVYFVLIFQVFTFEPELSPVGCIRKSTQLIKGHFLSTFILISLAGVVTYYLLPQIITSIFDGIGISNSISKMLLPFVSIFPELNLKPIIEKTITHHEIALFSVQVIIAQIIIQYTLPLRSLIFANWYKELNNDLPLTDIKTTKKRKTSKRPSEKLMENSKKKFSQKKIDENILRRAMEKDEG